MKIMVTTCPFGSSNLLPREMLKDYDVYYNDVDRKYTEEEVHKRLIEFQPDAIIAGTEKYSAESLDLVPDLKIISRVGIGIDSLPLDECEKRGIKVAYTPDAPSNAVAELTICQILNMLRHTQICDQGIRKKGWDRFIGKELRSCEVGIIGCGRIGRLIVDKMQGLKPRRIFVNDIDYSKAQGLPRSEYASKAQILSTCDIITVHIPYSKENADYISNEELDMVRDDVILLNMSRGGIINEEKLQYFLKTHPFACAAIDTYDQEPYNGNLAELPNAYLTPHLGSCTKKSRFDMEVGASEAVIDFIHGRQLQNQIL
jgi:D-3-phosphoglycerate dehydrogenase